MTEWLIEYADPKNDFKVESRWVSDPKLADLLVNKHGWKLRKSRETTINRFFLSRFERWMKKIGM